MHSLQMAVLQHMRSLMAVIRKINGNKWCQRCSEMETLVDKQADAATVGTSMEGPQKPEDRARHGNVFLESQHSGGRIRQVSDSSLVYSAHSRTARAAQRNQILSQLIF